MKLALAYSTKDSVELTKQTIMPVIDCTSVAAIYWVDGSSTPEGQRLAADYRASKFSYSAGIIGGADAAIVYKLSKLLNAPNKYAYIGLIENDVLLDEDWFAPTMALFAEGKRDGLEVGAVSPRSYADRILIQRDGYAVMHNLGAGVVIFTREAAEIVLRTMRTCWWPDSVKLFAQLSGIDLRTYAAFRGNEQFTSTDWLWDTMLAKHGLASLALTPAKVQMIGQVPPLAEQGLELTVDPRPVKEQDDEAFEKYRTNLKLLRTSASLERPQMIHREGAAQMFFPHQVKAIMGAAWRGNLELVWRQGAGPFLYRAGKGKDGAGDASLVVRISGTSSFLVSAGDAGAQVTIEDTRSGFKTSPTLQPSPDPVSIQVPGGPIPRLVTMDMAEGAVFHGLLTDDPQMLDTTWRFSWDQLPPAV